MVHTLVRWYAGSFCDFIYCVLAYGMERRVVRDNYYLYYILYKYYIYYNIYNIR